MSQTAQAQAQNDFSKGSIPKNILKMAGPMTVAQLVNVLYSMVDRIYIARIPGVGATALTGIGVTLPIISIIMGLANLCGTGGGPRSAIERGRGNLREAELYMGNAFTLLLIIGAAATAGMLLVKRPMLYLFGASPASFPYADDYLSIYLWGTLFVMVSLGMNPFINAQGFGRVGMLTTLLGAAVNLVLDPFFIFALGMGVRGAALATVIAQGCSAAWVLAFLTGKKAILRLRPPHMRLSAARAGRILTLGLAGFIVNLTNSLVQIVCNVTLQKVGGDLYVGVMTIINSLREMVMMVIQGMAFGAQPVASFNYGARKYQRVRHTIRFTTIVNVSYSTLVWAVAMLLPGPLISIFSSDAATIQAGIPALRVYFCMFIFMSLQFTGQSIFQSLGKSKQAIFFSLLRKAIINAPLTVLLARYMGTMGVFTAEAASQLVGGLASFLTMYFTVYRPLGQMRD